MTNFAVDVMCPMSNTDVSRLYLRWIFEHCDKSYFVSNIIHKHIKGSKFSKLFQHVSSLTSKHYLLSVFISFQHHLSKMLFFQLDACRKALWCGFHGFFYVAYLMVWILYMLQAIFQVYFFIFSIIHSFFTWFFLHSLCLLFQTSWSSKMFLWKKKIKRETNKKYVRLMRKIIKWIVYRGKYYRHKIFKVLHTEQKKYCCCWC